MSFARKISFAVVAIGSVMMSGAGVASADNTALGVSHDNPGLLSGFIIPTVVSDPLNNCANNTPAGGSFLTGTLGNACVIK
ncbi:chaplin family protein [Streptomyces sp. NPDC048527]|uniref:chaplin family protein n=1 Tax=Streptomyces sp. NPDC048527 TaxID=3365568 RepID=UPI00371A6088